MEIETPTGTLHVEDLGTGDPVVFISGMSQDHRAWVAQRPLSEHHRLLMPDNRGTGASSDFPEPSDDDPPTTGEMAEDILAVLKALDIPRAHVVGFSMGGRVAQWMGIRFPKRVASLVLIASSPGERMGVSRDAEADRLLEGEPMEQALLMYSPEWMAANPDLVREFRSATSTRSQQRHWHYLATHGHDSWDMLPRICAPTLIICGTEDRINPFANSAKLAERIPDAEVLVVRGGRHAVHAEYAKGINAALLQFWAKHPLG